MGVGGNVMPRPLYTGTVSCTVGIGLRYSGCSGEAQGQSGQERKVSPPSSLCTDYGILAHI